MNKKIVKFDLNPKSVKIKEILETKDFIAIEVWAISNAYPNNNNSHFPLSSMHANVENGNFYDKPVLGKWNSVNNDYEVHNSIIKYDNELDSVYFDYTNGECPMGTIRQSDSVKIKQDKDGLSWVVFTAILWTKYNYQAVKKLLKNRRKKVSVEVSVFKSHFDENGIEIFDEWSFDGVTILGNLPNSKTPAEAGIQNAHLTVLEKLEETLFNKQMRVVQFECSNYNNVINSDDTDLYKVNQKKEGFKLFTYEQKRSMLEEVLNAKLKDENSGDCCCIWVGDITDSQVWFYFNDAYYVATYTIETVSAEGENEQPKTIVEVNTDEKKKQLRAWTDFMEKNDDNSDDDHDDPDDDGHNGNSAGDSDDDNMCNFTAIIDGVKFTGEELLQKYFDEISNFQVEKQEAFEKYQSLQQDFDSLKAEKETIEQSFATAQEENKTFKEEVESLKDTLATMQYQQLADQALQFAQEQGLDKSKCEEFVTKCKSGEYEDFKAVQKDIVFAAFEVSGKSQSTDSSKSGEFVFKFPSKPSQVKDYKEDVFEGCRNIIKN